MAIPPTSVLFVSFSKRGEEFERDSSARYRCIHQAEKLRSEGIKADVTHIKNIKNVRVESYNRIICHRPKACRALNGLLKQARKHNIELQADFDDLLFCPEFAFTSPTVINKRQSLGSAQKECGKFLKALRQFTRISVSTDELSKRARQKHPSAKTEVIFNQLPSHWHQGWAKIPAENRLKTKIIRYLPGTANHTSNFRQAEAVLSSWLTQNPDVNLQIIGDIDSNILTENPSQVSQLPPVNFDRLPPIIRDSWVVIAPLEQNIFNDCKSGLKFWESAIYGIPVIASNNQDMKRFKNNGLFITINTEEWPKILDHLKNKDAYLNASESAKEAAEDAYFRAHQEPQTRFIISSPNTGRPIKSRLNIDYTKSSKLRKLRKLKRDPKLYFKDMIKKPDNA